MKRIILITLAIMLLSTLVFGANVPLKATWTPNTETDMKEYRLYRLDPTRILIGTIPHPPVLPYNFTTTAPDGSEVLMTFVLTAVDQAGNESGDSNVATFPFDQMAPGVPKNVIITK
jgi:hypothetical protein